MTWWEAGWCVIQALLRAATFERSNQIRKSEKEKASRGGEPPGAGRTLRTHWHQIKGLRGGAQGGLSVPG